MDATTDNTPLSPKLLQNTSTAITFNYSKNDSYILQLELQIEVKSLGVESYFCEFRIKNGIV